MSENIEAMMAAMLARIEASEKKNAELAAQLEAAKSGRKARGEGVSRWVVKGPKLVHFGPRGGRDSAKPFSLVLTARKEYQDGTPVTNASGHEVWANSGNGLYADWVECILRAVKETPDLLEVFQSPELIAAFESDADEQANAKAEFAERNKRRASKTENAKQDGASLAFAQLLKKFSK